MFAADDRMARSVKQNGVVRESVLRRRSRWAGARARFGLLLTLPAMTVFLVIIAYPLFNSMATSLFRASLLTPERHWVGLQNFVRVLNGAGFWSLVRTSAVFVAGTTVLGVGFGFLWALFLSQPFPGRNLLRGLSLVPWVVPSTVT